DQDGRPAGRAGEGHRPRVGRWRGTRMSAAGDGPDRPVFVLGCPRSGTTLMQVMLHSHRRIAVAPETRFILEAYRRRRRFGDLADASARRGLAEWIVGTRRTNLRYLHLDADDVTRRIVEGPPTLGSALGVVLQ